MPIKHFRTPRVRRGRLPFRFVPILAMAPLAAFAAISFWDFGAPASALPLAGGSALDREAASFARCHGPARVSCVVDGDTFWYRREKIRIADINTPEVSKPECAAEARLGERAARRLTELLNAGPFTLVSSGRDTDRYGRSLRLVTRGGTSLGAALAAEGLAERWQGRRGGWC